MSKRLELSWGWHYPDEAVDHEENQHSSVIVINQWQAAIVAYFEIEEGAAYFFTESGGEIIDCPIGWKLIDDFPSQTDIEAMIEEAETNE